MKYLLLLTLLVSCSQSPQDDFDITKGYDSLYLSGTATVTRKGGTRGYYTRIDVFMGRNTDSTYTTAIRVNPTNTNDSLSGSGEVKMTYLGEESANSQMQGYKRYLYKGTVVLNDTDYAVTFYQWRDDNYDGGMHGGEPELTINFETEKKN